MGKYKSLNREGVPIRDAQVEGAKAAAMLELHQR